MNNGDLTEESTHDPIIQRQRRRLDCILIRYSTVYLFNIFTPIHLSKFSITYATPPPSTYNIPILSPLLLLLLLVIVY